MNLRLIDHDSTPAMTPAELKEWGDVKITAARIAAIEAVAKSMHSEFLERGKSLGRADVRRWRGRARSAIEAWRKVESLTTELLNEIERTATSPSSSTDRSEHD